MGDNKKQNERPTEGAQRKPPAAQEVTRRVIDKRKRCEGDEDTIDKAGEVLKSTSLP